MIAGANRMRGRATGLAAMLAGLALSGCVDQRAEWARFENAMRAEGLMRTDYAPADAPFTKADLIRNFEKVAFFNEYDPDGGTSPQETPTPLHKMSGTLQWSLFAAMPKDHAQMLRLMGRVGRLTALEPRMALGPIDDDMKDAAVLVIFLGAEDREAMLDERILPGYAKSSPILADWLRDDGLPCMGFAYPDDDGGPARAFAFIRDELDGLTRRSCIEELVIQSLGLLNDGDNIRPSMFNDDEEFPLMTRHDELLLQILYDPRLKNGMTAAQAMPIVRAIVADMDLTAGADPIRIAEAAQ